MPIINIYTKESEKQDAPKISCDVKTMCGDREIEGVTSIVFDKIEAGETCEIEVMSENKAVIINRKKDRRYTPEDQKSEYAGDLGFDFVPLLQDKEVIWKSPA